MKAFPQTWFVGTFACALIGFSNPSHSQSVNDTHSVNGSITQEQVREISVKTGETDFYKPECSRPQTREDAEFCEDALAAQADVKQAELAHDQLAASVIGVFAVIMTLLYTAGSVRASQRSAVAAERAVASSEAMLSQETKATMDQLRAYVLVTEVTLASASKQGDAFTVSLDTKGHNIPVKPGQAAVVLLCMKNTGQTPAINLSGQHSVVKGVVWPIEIPDLPQLSVAPSAISRTILGSGMVKNISVPIDTISRDEFMKYNSRTHCIVAYGKIEYSDIFGVRHVTHYRFFAGGPVGILNLTMADHNDGNDMS